MARIRIYSWNVNGLRAGLKRGSFQKFIEEERPDILCLQETKAKRGQVEVDLPEYTEYWNSAKRAGYSGTAVFSKVEPLAVFDGFSDEICAGYEWAEDVFGDPLDEGRLQTLEFEKFFLVNVYVPNSKRGLERLGLRHQLWDPALLRYLKDLEKTKPVVICGDFNVAHQEIDLARPKDNLHNAGFTAEEREGMDNYTAELVDTFRKLHPDEVKYSWWSAWSKARERNIGWRIDYFLISPKLLPCLKAAEIHDRILGSDHAPVSIELEV